MVSVYPVLISGLGNYIVSASVQKVADAKKMTECKVDVMEIKIYDDTIEEYVLHDPDEIELIAIERIVASKYLNSLN